MKRLLCPKCGIPNLFLKNEKEERVNIFVLRDLSIIPSKEGESIHGFNIDEIFCLGCSWSGPITQLKRYIL